MKHIIFVAGLALAVSSPAFAADAPAKAEKVCIKTTDAKTGKEVEKCKTMKKHEKKEGTKVEGTKPDKK
jgi:opacity protein-like surface antigen